MFGDARLENRPDGSSYWWQGDPNTHRVPATTATHLCAQRAQHIKALPHGWEGQSGSWQVARALRARRTTQVLPAPQHDSR